MTDKSESKRVLWMAQSASARQMNQIVKKNVTVLIPNWIEQPQMHQTKLRTNDRLQDVQRALSMDGANHKWFHGGSICFCAHRASNQLFLWVSLHVFSAHVFFSFQPSLVTITQTSMHVPLHVLIIHHSPSMKDVHSISTEGQSVFLTPSLGWLNPSSPIPHFLSHQRRPRH